MEEASLGLGFAISDGSEAPTNCPVGHLATWKHQHRQRLLPQDEIVIL
jgi:hypothetical protein